MKTAGSKLSVAARPAWVLSVALGWSVLIVGFLAWQILDERATTRRIAQMEARAHFNKDQALRFWATRHGGVYVPVDTNTPPNLYLSHVPERDLETPSGRKLTLMNPAYMIRQVMEQYPEQYGVIGHLTSLRPLRPENVADDWETNALKAFEKGVQEVSEFTEIKGERYLRLMRPMITEPGCLKCHAGQGYKVGDVRGGVGIALRLTSLLNEQWEQSVTLAASHGIIWTIGMGGLVAVSGMVRRRNAERQVVADALRESEANLSRAQSIAHVGNWAWQVASGRVKGSAEMYRIFGITPETFDHTLAGLARLIHPDDLPRQTQAMEKILQGGTFESFEYRVLHPDGSTRVVQVFAGDVERDAAGKVVRVFGAVQDITERKRMESVLQARLRISDFALGHSLDELLTRTLDEAEALTGSVIGFFHFVEADQLTLALQTWSSHTLKKMCTAEGKGQHYPADQAGVWVDALRERRPVIHNDYASLPHRKGLPAGHSPVTRLLVVPVLRNQLVVALLGVGNKPTEYVSADIEGVSELANLSWDIIMAKRAEMALEKSRQLLLETEQMGKVGGWEFDIATGKQNWTEAVYKIHEVDSAFAPTVDKGVDFYTPESKPVIALAVREAVELGKPFDLELEIITAKGHRRNVRVIGRADQAHRRVVGFFQDITERKLAETEKEKLEAQNRQLQKSESLGRMAGAIAHHFNNHLAATLMNLELLQEDASLTAETRSGLAGALEATREAVKVSTQMLVYLGQARAKLTPVELSSLCQRCLPLLQVAMPKNVIFKAELPAPGPSILASGDLIRQVLVNLLTNAGESARNETNRIGLTVSQVAAAEIPGANRFPVDWQPQTPAYACLAVSDTGCGIAPGDIEKLFDPFYSTKFTGRGLGLPMVLGIVREHGGSIVVASQPGQGSCFRVFLPLLPETSPVPPPAAAVPAPARNTVLVVEDELPVLNVVVRALQKTGYPALAAKDGVEAVELFRRHQSEIACVLCDVAMPRMDGWKTLAALQEMAPGLPVIFSSGYDEDATMENHHAAKPVAYLKKPYDIQTLLGAIRQAIAAKPPGG